MSYHGCHAFMMHPQNPSSKICQDLTSSSPSLKRKMASVPFFAADGADSNKALELDLLEKQIIAKTQAELDVKRVKDAVLGFGDTGENSKDSTTTAIQVSQVTSLDELDPTKAPPSPLTIAIAAGSVVGLTSLAALHAPILSLGAFAATTYVAQRDPIKDEDLAEGDLTGPITRIIGRTALESAEKVKPTMQSMVRSSAVQKQLDELKLKYKELEMENEELRMKLHARDAIDKYAKSFTMVQLKDIAKESDMKVGGTKTELMLRLVESGNLNLDEWELE